MTRRRDEASFVIPSIASAFRNRWGLKYGMKYA